MINEMTLILLTILMWAEYRNNVKIPNVHRISTKQTSKRIRKKNDEFKKRCQNRPCGNKISVCKNKTNIVNNMLIKK